MKTIRQYVHCIRCHQPLEQPAIKRVCTETWYLDFAVCSECLVEMLAMVNPTISVQIDGDTLKTLLKSKHDEMMMASVFGAE